MSTKIREGQDMDVWEPWVEEKNEGWVESKSFCNLAE